MAVEDRSLSEFPRALQVAEQALVMISNPDGLGGYDTNGAVLTEVGKALLNVQYTQQLGNVSVFDAIKNTRVLSGTTTPTANEGANGQLYVKYETVSNVDTVIGMYFKKDGAWLEISLGGGGGSSTLAGLSDVNLTSPADGQLLRYNGTSGKWENAGIINDTTASASSVYSSNKVNSELALKQDALVTTTPTCAYTISIQSGGINAYKYGKILVVTGWLMPTYDKVANDTIAYVSGERVLAVFFASPNSSNGLNGRLKMVNQNNQVEILCENALKSTDYYSFTLVGIVQ